jgi:hypothetical protein
MTLLEHIQKINSELDPVNDHFALTEDIEYWNRSGVFTPEDFERYELATEYFEIYREIYNFKPHWGELFAKSAEELKALITDITK